MSLRPTRESITLDWPLLGLTIGRILDVMRNDTLLAIPFFTLMGIVLEKSGMAEDLLDTAGQLFGPIRGGLAYAVIFVGALLAATTGVVAASVIAMGLISMPIMLRYGYDRSLAAGVITASGTLAQIIPPSLVLIVLADQLGVSVGPMYAGAILPGLMLVGLFCLYIFGVTIFRPSHAPALPIEVAYAWQRCCIAVRGASHEHRHWCCELVASSGQRRQGCWDMGCRYCRDGSLRGGA